MAKFRKKIITVFVFLFILGLVAGFFVYKFAFTPNVKIQDKYTYLYIPTDATFNQVLDSLTENNILIKEKSFIYVSKIKKYDKYVKSGRYKIKNKETNWHLVNKLRAGIQEPVDVTIPSLRTIEQLCSKASKYLEFDSSELCNILTDKTFLDSLNMNKKTIACLFIPNTYEFYWNTSAKEFIARMKKEYEKFWTENRIKKAHEIGLSPIEVSILASIVQSEQMTHPDERPKIAGLYLNRLEKGIRLQSDPTLVYALGDFSINRVYNYHKTIDSPYNTYMYKGLPPGPILIPDISSLKSVLNAEEHDYIFMCAMEDFSGYHYFSKNLTQHIIYANKYHEALNRLNIR